jgi:hypothetical protein
MEERIFLANETGRQPEAGRNLGTSRSRQSKEHTMLRAENVNASCQSSDHCLNGHFYHTMKE